MLNQFSRHKFRECLNVQWNFSITTSICFQINDEAQIEFIREAVEKIGIPKVLSGMKQTHKTHNHY